MPLELETPAQFWFEEYGEFSKNVTPRIFDMAEYHPKMPLHPYTAGQFGSGVSTAFTAAFLESVNGFDPALGPGVPARAGEDLALFFQAVMHGHKLVYAPASPSPPRVCQLAPANIQLWCRVIGLSYEKFV